MEVQEWKEDLLPTIFHHKLRAHFLIKKFILFLVLEKLVRFCGWNGMGGCEMKQLNVNSLSFHKQFNAFSQKKSSLYDLFPKNDKLSF